ncbi:MAG TPA: hypothetical protein VNA19_05605 [Pyrinomonadaceae bacterium]|jgi:hypothetical protein|nr:hypothetical protein [Pyrinomonadaceae bacterium]
MKFHPGLLALGLLLCAVLACGGLGNKNQQQANTNTGASTNAADAGQASTGAVRIQNIYMAKDDGSGKYGAKTESFSPSDRKVYCVAELNDSTAGTRIKFVWYIVDAGGAQDEKIKEIEYTTSALENKVNGHLTLPQDWPKGKYKVEAYINDNLDKTLDYTVE